MTIPSWQRLLALLTYLLPWSDGLPFGRSLTSLFPVLQWLSLPALPLVLIEQAIPFGGFILFLVLFLGVVRNQRVPYFIRFNALQAILLDIILIVLSLAFNLLLAPPGRELCGADPGQHRLPGDARAGAVRDHPVPARQGSRHPQPV